MSFSPVQRFEFPSTITKTNFSNINTLPVVKETIRWIQKERIIWVRLDSAPISKVKKLENKNRKRKLKKK